MVISNKNRKMTPAAITPELKTNVQPERKELIKQVQPEPKNCVSKPELIDRQIKAKSDQNLLQSSTLNFTPKLPKFRKK